MNFYPHHIGDYRSDTAHLSNEEDLAYRRLLEMYYDTESPIPDETQWVARRLRVEPEAIRSVLSDFFLLTPEGWRHRRCDRELNEYRLVQERNRINGKKGGRPKGVKANGDNPVGFQSVPSRLPVGPQSLASGIPMVTDREGNQEPLPITQEPIHSDADASGSFAPVFPFKSSPSPKDIVFALGLPLLTSAGVAEKNARSFLGMQCKAHGDQAVADALSKCAQEQPVDPVSWLQRVLGPIKAGAGKGGKHSAFASKDYREGVSEDGFLG